MYHMERLFTFFIRLAKARQERRRLAITYSPERRTELRNGATLICIALLFVMCQIPKIFPDFYEALYCDHREVRYRQHYSIKSVLMRLCGIIFHSPSIYISNYGIFYIRIFRAFPAKQPLRWNVLFLSPIYYWSSMRLQTFLYMYAQATNSEES